MAETGELERANRLREQVYTGQLATLSETHMETLQSRGNLAMLLQQVSNPHLNPHPILTSSSPHPHAPHRILTSSS